MRSFSHSHPSSKVGGCRTTSPRDPAVVCTHELPPPPPVPSRLLPIPTPFPPSFHFSPSTAASVRCLRYSPPPAPPLRSREEVEEHGIARRANDEKDREDKGEVETPQPLSEEDEEEIKRLISEGSFSSLSRITINKVKLEVSPPPLEREERDEEEAARGRHPPAWLVWLKQSTKARRSKEFKQLHRAVKKRNKERKRKEGA